MTQRRGGGGFDEATVFVSIKALCEYVEHFDVAKDPGKSMTVSLDIQRKSRTNQLKFISNILSLPEGLKIDNLVAFFWFDMVNCLQPKQLLTYVQFFTQRGCSFCWHHLIFKSNSRCDEDQRKLINTCILSTCPAFLQPYDDCNNLGGTCLCFSGGWSYSLLECLVTKVRPINVDTCGGETEAFLEETSWDIDDLIEWGCRFLEFPDSNYPISTFASEIRDAFQGTGLDVQVELIVEKVEKRIQPSIGG